MSLSRSEAIDTHVSKVLATLADDCNDIDIVLSSDCHHYEWWEIRESIVRCLFELDHEQTRVEIHAKYVTENCL